MSAVVPKDFHFLDLKYAGRIDPLVHIEPFNDITGLQGLSLAERTDPLLTLEGQAREWY